MQSEEMRTVTMTRSDMYRIAGVLTNVAFEFDKGTASRDMWERIKADFMAQLDEQDPPEWKD